MPTLGFISLVIALCVSAGLGIIPMIASYKDNVSQMHFARRLSYLQFSFILFSFCTLVYAFVTNDFTLRYVALHSNTHLPMIYRMCAVWGAHEGSMLLWVLMLSGWTAAVAFFNRGLPLQMHTRILSVLGMISFGFLLFILFTSNPFVELVGVSVTDGRDLNPLLQDPGLISHPPMLYMGYVGFSVAFAFAIAALISGRCDASWAKWTRPWTLMAWCCLTLGIVLGSWWAYRQLGWGGWWFWDPVENASLMPWLSGTALFHSLIVVEKRNTFKAWTALLAIITFSLSLLGTFLVRSGVLVSVHAFAVDPKRGAFILLLLSFVIGASLIIYALRARELREPVSFEPLSRESFLLSNNVILTVMMATVLLGTLYPLVIQGLGLGKLSVGAPYFNTIFTPLGLFMLILMAIAPLCHWKRTQSAQLIKSSLLALAFACLAVTAITLLSHGGFHPLSLISSISAIFLVFIAMTLLKRVKVPLTRYGMVLAHIGVAVFALGVINTTVYEKHRDVNMRVGESMSLAGYSFHLKNIYELHGENYGGLAAHVDVTKNGHHVKTLSPELRSFPVTQMTIPKAATAVNAIRDLYVALAEPLGKNTYAFRIYYKPFIRWIWYGGLLMLLGGLIVLIGRRRETKTI